MQRNIKYTIEEVKEYVCKNSNCELLSNTYINSHTNMEFKCACGNSFITSFTKFMSCNKRQCNECGDKNARSKQRKTHQQFCQEVFNLVGNEYNVVDNYINNSTFITFYHKKCGNYFKTSPNKFLNGARCKYCNYSKGETEIANFLNKKGIRYISQYVISDLKGDEGYLMFDFYLPNYNACIEYQGKQHYEPVIFGNYDVEKAKENLIKQQEYDEKKRNYCFDNNINYLDIGYWSFENIGKRLSYFLENYVEYIDL